MKILIYPLRATRRFQTFFISIQQRNVKHVDRNNFSSGQFFQKLFHLVLILFLPKRNELRSKVQLAFQLVLILLFPLAAFCQPKLQVTVDTVKVQDAELVLRNTSKNIAGFLVNLGNGVTQFQPLGKSI